MCPAAKSWGGGGGGGGGYILGEDVKGWQGNTCASGINNPLIRINISMVGKSTY